MVQGSRQLQIGIKQQRTGVGYMVGRETDGRGCGEHNQENGQGAMEDGDLNSNKE